LIINVAA